MNLIYYTESASGVCTLYCPFRVSDLIGTTFRVGSYGCSKCKFFIDNSIIINVVLCIH